VETPLSVIVFEPLPKVRAPLLEPMYSFPKAALAVALGAFVYVALLKLPVNVALGVVLGVQLVFVPIAVELLFQSADVCARASGTNATPAASASNTAIRIRMRDESGECVFIGRQELVWVGWDSE
jgi:hypothetical protein